MKCKLCIFIFISIGTFIFCNSLAAQNKNDVIKPQKITEEQLNFIKNDKNFKDALILIEEGNVQIEYTKAEVINIDKKSFQAKFNIIDNGNIFEYKSMVFLKSNDKSLCAFEEINKKFKESNSNQSVLRGCNWTPWFRVNNSASSGQCWDFWWCWNASKKGRYYEYYRTCNKNGQSTRRQTKWFREDCECR